MKFTRRRLLPLLLSALALPKTVWSTSEPRPGDFKIYLPEMEISGVLQLSQMDMIMRAPEKIIFGDGHSHRVPLSEKSWEFLLLGQELLVRTDVDSATGMHSHWVRVRVG